VNQARVVKPRSPVWCLALLGVLALGCPKRSKTQRAPEPCKQMGEQCELEPGKLGACAYKANCTTGNCLYCQSQH
jgi:hypothetical protein